MKTQVAKLFHMEYNISILDFEKYMSRLYEHDYQKNKCILIVAEDGEKIVGFQSYFYWPYLYNNHKYNSFQSGNSLVHPEYRGKKLFARMLSFLNENKSGYDIDFLIGFPVKASFNSFIKNGWINLFDLQWYIKIVNPFAFVFSKNRLNKFFTQPNKTVNENCSEYISLSEEYDFRDWKNQLVNSPENHFQYIFSKEDNFIIFDLKFQVRKNIIHEIVIGNIRFKKNISSDLYLAFESFFNNIRKCKCVSILSIAINEKLNISIVKNLLIEKRFKKINKKIYFILKPQKAHDHILDASIWNIGRADIDTW